MLAFLPSLLLQRCCSDVWHLPASLIDRTAPVVPASARASGSDPASKKAEVRARRFGARDKKSKMAAVAPGGGGGGAAAAAAASGGLETAGGRGGGDEPVAQSLEALTRRAEAVAEDLERTQAGLVELEAEEAEEAGEAALADGGEGGSPAADPLDMFMSENRKKERQQAVSRLTAQRGALLEEQARLKVMVEAARPSMPSLKGSVPAKAADPGARAHAGVAEEKGKEEEKAEADDKSDTIDPLPVATGAAREITAKADQGNDRLEKEDSSPPPPAPATMAAPARPRRAAGPPPGEGMQGEGRGERGGTNGNGGMPAPTGNEEKKAPAAKRRGTPVGAAMLPPPPAKRPQRSAKRETNVTPAPPRGGGGGGPSALTSEPKAKRTVKGPAAMPPPSNKNNPSVVTAGVAPSTAKFAKRSRGPAEVAGKDVLEGGDVDWVPPKDALEKMAALNQKFGY